MSGLVNGRRVATLAFGLTLLAATVMLAPASSHAYGHGRGYGGGHGGGYGGGARVYGNHGGYGGRARYGGGGFYGGARYYRGPRYYGGPHYYPRGYVSFGFGIGVGPSPYYYPPYPYHYYPHPEPSVVYREKEREPEPEIKEKEAEPEIDVDNEPPAGCYYYDRYCDRKFKTLDDYTHHLDESDDMDHPNLIDIVSKDSGKTIRTLEYVDYWEVKKD